jgi:hypothetical protein
MADRVDKFLDDLDSALEAEERRRERGPLLETAARHASRLADALDELERTGWTSTTVAGDEVRGLYDEVSRASTARDLPLLVENARALLKVVEDGIVDGDPARLRAGLERAQALTRTSARSRGKDQPHLPRPIRVSCRTCDTGVVGHRHGGASNWNAVTKTLRDHEREQHDGYSPEIRDELRRALDRIRAGDEEVVAARYVLRQS